ncbi:conserved hypothetical protein [Histoplasma capsulatum var. duboisii H88]|uniref:Uncharacterized protein n=1 Tax=Ajellomyces capsulatus (strain H88) TaxID=544711 RepID=F0UV01_AJEC8|nr:conserved hypothetical protein [Histoplasma capsulatum var. duboisii H88]QSS51053.1 hypothetical protein I7I53_06274 [Histoplasma capsulatum var. duboisii H88]
MFEDFSFSSSRRTDRGTLIPEADEDMVMTSDNTPISPFSSRSPSPVPLCRNLRDHSLFPRQSRKPFELGPAPTSIPYNYSDRRRLSIGALAKRLNAQSLDKEAGSDSDEGPTLPVTPPRSACTDAPPIWLEKEHLGSQYREQDDDSSWAEPSLPSTPMYNELRRTSRSRENNISYLSPYASITAHDEEQFSYLRQHRENLSLLQCTSKTVVDTVRIALLLEESNRSYFNETEDDRHPSSLAHLPSPRKLPPHKSNHCQCSSRRSSTSTEPTLKSKLSIHNTYRVEKSHPSPHNSSHSGSSRRTRKSPQGLRRRSLVLAAVTAIVEAEAAEAVEKVEWDREARDIRTERPRTGNSDVLDFLDERLKDLTTINSC